MSKRTDKQIKSRMLKVRRRLFSASAKEPDVLLVQYDNSVSGFDEEQVEDMRDEYGKNEITKVKQDNRLKRLIFAFINPFTIVLMIIGFVSLISDPIAGIIVFSMVLISGLLKFSSEMRNSMAADKLTDMVATTVHVQRQIENEETEELESKKQEIPLDELVVGDVVYLAAGDMIPADVRIIRAKDLFVSQASLTGESEPVEKFAQNLDVRKGKGVGSPLECNNLAFMGTNVISGSATAVVIAVGDDTIFGNIARQLQVKKEPTSFEKGISSVSWVLIRFMLVMVPIVFLVNGWLKGDWQSSLLFAISVAVGLTPEMLPMIVSANLAKGAVTMSRKKVIVKDLNSIQNFGAMDILCTDKTGTITQDKVILQYHLDVHGKEDNRVLSRAYLNSYFQTGLKNLMDISVIEKATEAGIAGKYSSNIKVDEIPFDFNRRRMSVVVANHDNTNIRLITKGAIEEMLTICSNAEYHGEIIPITPELKKEILGVCNKYNDDGMRVLGVAQRIEASPKPAYGPDDERDMTLIGYLAFLDPPKDTSAAAIAALKEYGVNVKVLTGDNDAVTRCVCRQVGINVGHILLGSDIERMNDKVLQDAVEKTNVFAKLSPSQKERIVKVLRDNGHVVGFMGDGINDAAAMKAADVGISVDTAVDIAKESANIILLEKDLMVLEQGIIEGRKIYGNIVKYIKMTASSNFGNMFSVLVASALLPFLPMLPIQILVLNLIYDISCTSIPWDNVDSAFLKKPRAWEAKSVTKFMLWFGPTSSIFDITTYGALFWFICPHAMGGSFASLGDGSGTLTVAQEEFASLFQTGWFIESLITQTLVIHMIRSPHFPYVRTRASWQVTILTLVGIGVGLAMPYIPFINEPLVMTPLGITYFAVLGLTLVMYLLLITLIKGLFTRRYSELL